MEFVTVISYLGKFTIIRKIKIDSVIYSCSLHEQKLRKYCSMELTVIWSAGYRHSSKVLTLLSNVT